MRRDRADSKTKILSAKSGNKMEQNEFYIMPGITDEDMVIFDKWSEKLLQTAIECGRERGKALTMIHSNDNEIYIAKISWNNKRKQGAYNFRVIQMNPFYRNPKHYSSTLYQKNYENGNWQ